MLTPTSRRLSSLVSLLAVATLAACGGGGGDPVEPQPTPAQVVAVTGAAAQTATVGTAVPIVPTVRVVSNQGQPMAGVTVAFTVTGGGSIGAASAQTNAEGIASPGSWTLGPTAGANTLVATVGTLSATFTATGTTTPPPSSEFLLATQVDVGAAAVCARSAAGQLSCWGRNGAALLGDGTTTFRQFPVAVTVAGVSFSNVAVGYSNSCALASTGAAYCWGGGRAIGDGSVDTPRAAPVAVSGGHVFTKLVVGTSTACGLKADGSAWCWGATTPTGSTVRAVPTRVSTTLQFTDIAAGSSPAGAETDYNCGISTTGATYCWGVTGIGTGADAAQAPAVLPGGITFTSLTLGRHHGCGLTSDGTAYCWGANDRGQVGDNTSGNTRTAPVAVTGSTRFASLTAGSAHSCGLTSAGAAWCWGANSGGALGLGADAVSFTPRPAPAAVTMPAGVTFTAISAGMSYSNDPGQAGTCAVTSTSAVYCWGTRATSSDAIVIIDPLATQVRNQ